MSRAKLKLVQLPVPPPAALAATGNVPLAAGCLAVAAKVHGLTCRLAIDVVPPSTTDRFGDTALAEHLAADEPDYLGLSLYLWNLDRSLHLAREVKRRSPHTRVVVGGPEVSPDNRFLLAQPGFDLAVSGEGEETLVELMGHLLDGRDPTGLEGVSVRKLGALTPFGPPRAAKFPLSDYGSPYLQDFVPVEPERSAYVEGARGCRSKCTFCFYPKAASGLRVLDPSQVEAVVSGLRARGAREISFLDPTFNHRPDFEAVLEALGRANVGRTMSFFAEVRPEGLSAAHAKTLKRVGFDKLEIGLQSVSPQTLKRVQRGGNAAKVAAATKLLRAEGIDLLIDLMVGLPGDVPDDIARGVDFLEEHDLGHFAQVFALYVLPGTAMRESAERDGLVFEPEPPYRIIRTATMSEDDIATALASAEERLGRRIDERPRPHLVAASPPVEPPDVFEHVAGRVAAAKPGAQHCAIWFRGPDLFERRAELVAALDARAAVDPYATLDVVLAPTEEFPLDLLEVVRAKLDDAPGSYATRSARHRGVGHSQRVTVVLGSKVEVSADWLEAVRETAQVFREQSAQQAARDVERLGDELPGARIISGTDDRSALERLRSEADPEAVIFADRVLETDWQRHTLGYGDAGN